MKTSKCGRSYVRNKMKTSLMAQGQCVKKVRPMAKPGTINSFTFSFKTKEPEKDMLFVLIQNPEINMIDEDKYKEYLAVELRNKKIRFSWNAGGGSGSVDSDVVIQSETDVIKETEKWYQVKAERTARLGRLSVHKMSLEADPPKTSSSPVGASVIGLGEKTDIFIAGVPENYPVPNELTKFNFSGCMCSMCVNDQQVRPFNFETNSGDTCQACLEITSQAPRANVYSFDGTGYAVTDKNRISSPLLANIILDFRTYWDNASLFFVGNEKNGEYMSLELLNGKVVFSFYLGNGTYGTLKSNYRYNTNNWVSVAVARSGVLALLEIGSEGKLIEAPAGDDMFDGVESSDLFYGGMPLSVNMSKYSSASGREIITDRFLGCMKGLQISVDSVTLWDGKSTVGVTEGCRNSGLRQIGFYGSGFAEYQGVSLDRDDGDLSVSFSTEEPDALLLLSTSIIRDQFYSLTLTDGYVEGRFSGGGSTTVIVTSDKTYNDGKLHTLDVKKTYKRIVLFVDDKTIGKGMLWNRFDKIVVREDGGLYLGGLPANFESYNQTAVSRTLNGCLSDVVINGIALNINDPKQYNMADIGRCRKRDKVTEGFNTNPPPVVSNAPAEMRPSQAPGANVYSFDGTGYAVTDKNRIPSPLLANIILDFRTYWDNASLFFVGNEKNGEYMSLELLNGKVVFSFYLGNGTYGTLESKYRYNTNNWVSFASARSGLLALIEIGRENMLIEAPAGDYRFDGVESSDLFYGGMPLSVNMSKYSSTSGREIITDRFLGCMKGLQISVDSVDSVNLWDGKSTVGVTEGCKNSGLRQIGFYGSGFAEYPGVSLDGDDGDLSVSFSTDEPNALLLLSKSIIGDHFYSLTLTDGYVEGRFSGGDSTPVIVTSDKTYNDGKLHNIDVKKTNRKIELFVDDKTIGRGRLENRFDKIVVREDGGLYLGGLPANFESANQAAVSRTLDGCLSDVVINGIVLNINDPKQYSMADIGRCRNRDKVIEGFNTNPPSVVSNAPAEMSKLPQPDEEKPVKPKKKSKPATTEKMVSDETPALTTPAPTTLAPKTRGPTSCDANTRIFDYLKNDAFSFGEEETSLIQIKFSKKEVQRKFEISLEFRTFYKDGLLLYLSNQDHTVFLAAQIRNGDIVVSFDRKRSVKEMLVNTKDSLGDGDWHTLVISKNKRRITATVDNKSKKGAKIAKVLKVDIPLYVGGVANSFAPLMNDQIVPHSTRGCIRNLQINNDLKTFDDATVTLVKGVDYCFPKVERGAHFTGDSYGVYAERFEVGAEFIMELEFRTTKPEGIFATVSNPGGNEALALQLHKGQVKLNIMNSGGHVMASTSINSAFSLCDNEWHKIRATLKKNNVTVEVDDKTSFSCSGRNGMTVTATSAPLYLGGKPYFSNQAAAMTSLGFEGCLRNVVVQSKPVNWFKLARAVAIHKTSCVVL